MRLLCIRSYCRNRHSFVTDTRVLCYQIFSANRRRPLNISIQSIQKFCCNIDGSVTQKLLKSSMTKKLTKQPEAALAGSASGSLRPRRAGATHSKKSASSTVKTTTTEQPVDQDAVARLAYSYWEARGCAGGSPEEDWFRAELEVLKAAVAS
jgi:hypothetical protein